MDCSPPASSVHGILQARILKWVVMPSSRGSSWPRNQTCVSCCYLYCRQILYCRGTGSPFYKLVLPFIQKCIHINWPTWPDSPQSGDPRPAYSLRPLKEELYRASKKVPPGKLSPGRRWRRNPLLWVFFFKSNLIRYSRLVLANDNSLVYRAFS